MTAPDQANNELKRRNYSAYMEEIDVEAAPMKRRQICPHEGDAAGKGDVRPFSFLQSNSEIRYEIN